MNLYRSTQMGSVISVQIREWMNGRLRGRRQLSDVLSIRGRWSLLWLEENLSTLRWTRYAGGHTFYLLLSREFSSFVWMIVFPLSFLSFLTVRAAEWIHWEEGDVCGCGVHEFGKCAPGWTTFPFPGCWVGGQHCPRHLPGSIRKMLFFHWSADLGFKTRILVPTEQFTVTVLGVKSVITLLHRTVCSRWVCRLFLPSQSLFVLWRWAEWKNRMSLEKKAPLASCTST